MRLTVSFALVLVASTGVALLNAPTADAIVFTVTKTADTNDGACDSDCSLREAINAANATSGPDSILLPAGLYFVSGLVLQDEVTIIGAGAATTILDGNGAGQIFSANATASLSNMTIQNGRTETTETGLTGGAAIFVNASSVTTVDNCILKDNTVFGQFIARGGAIHNSGQLLLSNSTVSNNRVQASDHADGGGLFNSGTVIIHNSTISANLTRGGVAVGAAIFSQTGSVTIDNSTISDNMNDGFPDFAVVRGSDLTIHSSTLSGNDPYNVGATVSLENVILANATSRNCETTVTSLGHNLDDDGTCSLSGPGDLSNMAAGLGPLASNGGPTQTHELLPGSPARDAASANCPSTDQRGVMRPLGPACDIGAFEAIPECDLQPDGSPCNDYIFCNGTDTCFNQQCAVHSGDPCNAAGVCGHCNEMTDTCADPIDTPCTDDANPCTRDVCDGSGACAHPDLTLTPCDDGIACNGQDMCLEGTCFHSQSCLGDFKCWKVKDLRQPRFAKLDGFQLDDEFGADMVRVRKPALVCNAAAAGGSGVANPGAHLCCYQVRAANPQPPASAGISDSFGTLELGIKKPQMLCQPCSLAAP